MPKKYQPSYKPSSNYVHPSLSSSRDSPSNNAASSSSQSVNDRLNQLRREQAPRSAADRRNELTETLTARPVHPAVRQILNLPEVAAPRPRLAARTASGRRVPGPSAPQSWLERSRHAPDSTPQAPRLWKVMRPRFTDRLPSQRSLVHYTCKTLAKNWEFLLEYEQHYLATLPMQLKDILLSYLAAYGPEEGITLETLRVLFLTEHELDDATGSDELVHLDLTGMISKHFTLGEMTKYMTQVPGSKEPLTEAMNNLSVADEVADSWEDAEEADVPVLPKSILNPRFPNLTHLSLAYPRKTSWSQLLTLSSHLPTLTHLSLAFWPKPTLTPNATAASMASAHGRVSLGGTHFYSEMDDDWQEAANILRRLANNTYCLKWLDLCGCEWTPALVWGIGQGSFPRSRSGDLDGARRTTGDWDIKDALPCPNWNSSWRQVTHLNLSQGWIPHSVNAIRALPAGMLSCELLSFLRSEKGRRMIEKVPVGEAQTAHQIRRWIEKEGENRSIAYQLNNLRRSSKGPYCEVDFGWSSDILSGSSNFDEVFDV